MKKPSVSIKVQKSSKNQDSNNPPDKPELAKSDIKTTNDTVEAATEDAIDETLAEFNTIPQTKSELIDLYFCEPLPINTSVNSKELLKVNKQRVALYQRQLKRTEIFYTATPAIRPTYMVHVLKEKFVEFQQFETTKALDKRGIVDLESTDMMWQQLHIVDDLIADIVRRMPAQNPVGWQLTSVNKNHLKLPTVGRLRDNNSIADQGSLNSYVLGHFGVMSYTYDRAYFIGHVMGYLFCCYYLAHLSISYGVTPLPEDKVDNFDYASLETAKMVRLLHGLDVHCKRRIYQLAVLCARLSCYQLDKHIEKMLIAEVNEFDKKQQIAHLDALLNKGIMPDMPDMIDLQKLTDFPNKLNDDK